MASQTKYKFFFVLIYFVGLTKCTSFARLGNSSFGHTYANFSARSTVECCIQCEQDRMCNSLNFALNSKTCELNNRSPADFPYTSITATTAKDLYYLNIDPCPDTWILYDRHCYHVVIQQRTWADSEANCQTMGATLTDILDAYENTFVTQIAVDAGVLSTGSAVWTGLQGINTVTPQVWTSGKPVTYVSFAVGEPNNVLGAEDCLDLVNDGLWNDDDCNRQKPSVCKKKHY